MGTKPARGPAPGSAPQPDDLTLIRDQLKLQEMQLDYAQKYQSVLNDVRDLKASVEAKWLYFKIAVTAIVAVAGIFGVRTWTDLHARVNRQIQNSVKESKEFYDDLMAASALIARHEYAAAVPGLMRSFNRSEEHTYDKSLLIPLVTALDASDDWSDALAVIAKLQSNPSKFEKINDASIYTMIAAIQIQSGLTELGPVGRPNAEAAKRMEAGVALLKRASIVPPDDAETRRQMLTNYWFYYLANGDLGKSEEMVKALDALPRNVEVYSWDHMSSWKAMQSLAQRSPNISRAAKTQWARLSPRYIKD